jgi:glycosyltransferase involved in cell wall biosynthesis
MKVLFVTISSEIKDGSTIALKNEIGELQKSNVEIVVAVWGNNSFKKWLVENHIKSYLLWKPCPFVKPNTKFFFKYLWCLFKMFIKTCVCSFIVLYAILKEKPDIVHSNNSHILYGFLAAKMGGVPHLWHLREYLGDKLGLTFYPSLKQFKKILRYSYTISITDDISKYYDRNNSNSDFVVYDGVVSNKMTLPFVSKDPYFLYVGAVNEHKGCSDLIAAFIDFSNRNKKVNLVIVGSGSRSYVEFLKYRLRENGIEKRVFFTGYREDRFSLMKKALCLVVPSKCEGLGFITVEGIVNGCPIVGRNTTGTKIVMNLAPNVSFPFSSVSEMSSCFDSVCNIKEDDMKSNMQRSQIYIRDFFSIEKSSDSLISVYKKLLNKLV